MMIRWYKFLLLFSFAFQVLFDCVEKKLPLIAPYFFTNEEVYKRAYIYFTFEHFTIILITVCAFMVAKRPPKSTLSLEAYMVLCMCDYIDFLFTGNTEYFYIQEKFPVSWNVVQTVVFIIVMISEEFIERYERH